MFTFTRWLGVTALAVVGILVVGQSSAQAQVLPNSQGIVNPYFRVAPNLPLNQAAYNVRTMGRAFQNVPPWTAGYNPYPSPIINPFPTPSPYYTCLGFCPGPLPYSDPSLLATGSYGGGYGAAGTLYSAGGGYGGGSSMYSNPYGGGYGGYGSFSGYGLDPFAGYMSGAAQVISSQAQFMSAQAQADITREQLKQMRIDTHRKLLEEWQYERNLLANVPDPRIQEQKFALQRAVNNPVLTEILSADSLNTILKNVKALQDKGGVGPTLPLDEELLKAINLKSGERGNIGLLKNGGRLNWPLPLQGIAFEGERKRLTQLAQDAVKQVEFNGKVDPGTLQQLQKDVAALQERLGENLRELTPTQGVDARRYLGQLEDALTGLQQADVQNFVNGKWALRGKTVGEVVKFLSDSGLSIAPATQGDEPAYQMLHQRLAAYNVALEQQVAQK